LRAMAEVHISVAWILADPDERTARFIHYALGQAKLELEHRRQHLGQDISPDQQDMLDESEAWINAQQFTFLTTVNLGSWSGLSARKMAEEADCLDFYDMVYTPFSA